MLEPGGSPFRSVRYADQSALRTAPRVALAAVLVLVVVLVGGLAVLWTTANQRIDATSVVGLERRAEGAPLNLLVTSRAGADAPLDGVVVVQLSAGRDDPAVLVLPAALEVEVAGQGATTLSRAPEVGGMALVVEEVAAYTGMPLHHYVDVDRAALAALVDANGGLDDCPAQDVEPCPRLIGSQVLERLAPPEGAVTGRDRVVAHLDVLRTVATEAARTRTALDPRRALRWSQGVDAALDSDLDPGVRGLRDLATQLAAVDPEALDVRILPGLIDDGRVSVTPETATVLLEAFVAGDPLPADVGLEAPRELVPEDVTVQVLNGLGEAGVAGDAADRLTEQGFVVVEVGNAPRFDRRAPTTVGYTGADRPLAELVASFLPGAEVVEARSTPPEARVVVTVGAS